jgi:uncharacterized RDD family membrane protein YckC
MPVAFSGALRKRVLSFFYILLLNLLQGWRFYAKAINLTAENATMPAIKVPTSFNIDVEFEIPEFFRRLLAWLIDVLIEFCYLMIALYILNQIDKSLNRYDHDSSYNMNAIALLFMLPLFIYHVVMEITMNGQSIGKKAMSLKVVNENGGRASFSQFFIRWILRVSDIWIVVIVILLIFSPTQNSEMNFALAGAIVFLITDVVLAIASKKGQRIGDMLARTILIRTNRRASIEETVFQEVADSYTPVYPQIMQLSDRDINAIKNILETARKKGDMDMAVAAGEKIKGHLKIESSLSPFEFLEILLKDYNYLSVK